MRLLDAFRLRPTDTLALTGAGGKSAALFRLGRETLAQDVRSNPHRAPIALLTATAHLSQDQIGLADHHFVLESEADLPTLSQLQHGGVFLFTGPAVEQNRLAGLPLRIIDLLRALADELNTALFLEADGSRQLPLKAPAEHEPILPQWIDKVVVVAGLSGLGKPLGSDWVHRPERFSALAGLQTGDLVQEVHLGRVLIHPSAGLKGIPQNASRVALLNQAGSPELQAAALRLAATLLPVYQAVVVADLPPASHAPAWGQNAETRPKTEAETQILAVHERIAGVVLAAGAAARFGDVKQILIYQGKPLVRRAVETAISAGLDPVVVVTGHAAEAVRSALHGLPATIIHNPDWQTGQASSVAVGLGGLPEDVGGAIFLMADQPRLPVSLLRNLVELHASRFAPIVAPLVDGERANPVLFDRRLFVELQTLTGDVGGRALFRKYSPVWLPWGDPAVLMDIDTHQDYETLLQTNPSEPPVGA